MADQKDLEKRWNDLRATEAKLWDEYRKLSLEQKLNMVLETVSKAESINELWADNT